MEKALGWKKSVGVNQKCNLCENRKELLEALYERLILMNQICWADKYKKDGTKLTSIKS